MLFLGGPRFLLLHGISGFCGVGVLTFFTLGKLDFDPEPDRSRGDTLEFRLDDLDESGLFLTPPPSPLLLRGRDEEDPGLTLDPDF